jgi:hypothetical protein
MEPAQVTATVSNPDFQRAAANAIAAEVGGRPGSFQYTSEAVAQRKINLPTIGSVSLVLGAAFLYFFVKRSK